MQGLLSVSVVASLSLLAACDPVSAGSDRTLLGCVPEYQGEFQATLDSSGFRVDDEAFEQIDADALTATSLHGQQLDRSAELSYVASGYPVRARSKCDRLQRSWNGEPLNATLQEILSSSAVAPVPVLHKSAGHGGIVAFTPTLRSVVAEGEDMQSFWPLIDVPGEAPTGVYAGFGMRKGIEARDGRLSGSRGTCAGSTDPKRSVQSGAGTHWGLNAAQLGANAYLQVDPPGSWLYEPDRGQYPMNDTSFDRAPKLSYELFFTRYNGPLFDFNVLCADINRTNWSPERVASTGARGDDLVSLRYNSPNCLVSAMELNISDAYPSPSPTPSVTPSPTPSPQVVGASVSPVPRVPSTHDHGGGVSPWNGQDRGVVEAAAGSYSAALAGPSPMPGAHFRTFSCSTMACAFKLTTMRQHYMYYGQHPTTQVPQIYLDGELGVGWSWNKCQHCRCSGSWMTDAAASCGKCMRPTRMAPTAVDLLAKNQSFTIGSPEIASAFGTISHVAIVSNDKRRRVAPQFSQALPPIEGGVWEFVNTTTAGYFSGRVGVVARCEQNDHVLIGAPIARNWMAGWSGPAWHGSRELQAERNLVAEMRRRAQMQGQSNLPTRYFYTPQYLMNGDKEVARDSNSTEPNGIVGDLATGDKYADTYPAPWSKPRCVSPWAKESPYRRDFHKHGIKSWGELHEEVVRVTLTVQADPAEYPRGSSNAEALADAIQAELLDVILQAEPTRIQVLLEQDTPLQYENPPGMRVLVVIWPSYRRAPPSGTYGQDDDHIVGASSRAITGGELAPWVEFHGGRYAGPGDLGSTDYATALNSPRMMGYQIMDLFASPTDSIAGDTLRSMMQYATTDHRPGLEFLLLCKNHQYAMVCSATWLFEIFFAALGGQFGLVILTVTIALLVGSSAQGDEDTEDLGVLSVTDGKSVRSGQGSTSGSVVRQEKGSGSGSGSGSGPDSDDRTKGTRSTALGTDPARLAGASDPSFTGSTNSDAGGMSSNVGARSVGPERERGWEARRTTFRSEEGQTAMSQGDFVPPGPDAGRGVRPLGRFNAPYGVDHDGQELPQQTPEFTSSRGNSGGIASGRGSVNGGASVRSDPSMQGERYLASVRSEASSSVITASKATLTPRFMSQGMQPYLIIVPSAAVLAVGSVYVYALKVLMEEQWAGSLTLCIALGIFVLLNVWQAWYRSILLRQGGVSSDPVLEAWLSRHWSHRAFFFLCQTLSCLIGSNFAMLLQARLPCCTCTAMPLKAMLRRPEAFPDLLRQQALIPHVVLMLPTMGFLVVRLAGVTPRPNAEWPAGVVLAICFLYLLLVSVGALVAGLELDVLAEADASSQSMELRRGLMAGDSQSARGRPGSVLTLGTQSRPGQSVDTRFSQGTGPRAQVQRMRGRLGGRMAYAPSSSLGGGVSGTQDGSRQFGSAHQSATGESGPDSAGMQPSSANGAAPEQGDFLPTAATVDDRQRQGHNPSGFGLPGGPTRAELAGSLSRPQHAPGSGSVPASRSGSGSGSGSGGHNSAGQGVRSGAEAGLGSSMELQGSMDDLEEVEEEHLGGFVAGDRDGAHRVDDGRLGQPGATGRGHAGVDFELEAPGSRPGGAMRGAIFGRGISPDPGLQVSDAALVASTEAGGGGGVLHTSGGVAITSMDESDDEDVVDEDDAQLELQEHRSAESYHGENEEGEERS